MKYLFSRVTHCVHVKPYGDKNLDQHCLGWLAASRNQAITWTNADLSVKMFCGMHMRGISLLVLMNLIHNLCLEIKFSKLLPHIPGVNKLKDKILNT